MKQFFKVLAITAVWATSFSGLTTAQVVNPLGPEAPTNEGIQEISQIVPLAELDQPESDQPVKAAKTIISSEALWKKRLKNRKANIVVPNTSGKNQTAQPSSKTLEILVGFPQNIKEGGRPQRGYVKLSLPLKKAVKFNVAVRNSKELSASKTVTIPAGKTLGYFQVSARNDKLTNLTRPSDMAIYIKKVVTIFGQVSILDDETPPRMKLILLPMIEESEGYTKIGGTLVLDKPVDVQFKVNFSNNLPEKLFSSKSEKLRRGEKSLRFMVGSYSDKIIHGDVPVILKAECPGIPNAFATIIALDNEPRVLTLTFASTVPEGGTTTGKVTVSGVMGYALDVNLTTNRPDQITMPSVVRIPKGASEATFTIGGLDNISRDGSREILVTASATNFTGTSKATQVRDNEVVSYRIAGLGDIVNITSPVRVEVISTDVEGKDILNPSTAFAMRLVLPDGRIQDLTSPAMIPNSAGGLEGNLMLPPLADAPLKIQVVNPAGLLGESVAFDVMRVLQMKAQNMVWDPTRGRIFASATKFKGSTHENQIVTIDPETLQILASGKANPDPVDIVLHDEGTFLYQSSRDGFIYKFSPDTLKILSQFSVRENALGNPFYAGDFFPIKGSPDSLVVSIVDWWDPLQRQKSVETRIFDSGVKRFPRQSSFLKIEPSSGPLSFYGYDRSYGGSALSIQNTGSSGVFENSGSFVGNPDIDADFRSYGDRIFSDLGYVIDGKKLKRLGKVDFQGQVFPDTKSNRVFYLEDYTSWSLFQRLYSFESIAAYDPISLKRIARLMLPKKEYSADNFIRWGKTGLAYRTADNLVFINSRRLVPSQPSADLAVAVKAPTDPVGIDIPIDYTIQVTNHGPNLAKNVSINVKLSEGQSVGDTSSDSGTPVKSDSMVTLELGDVAINSSVTMLVTTLPKQAGQVSCSASIISDSADHIVADNSNEQQVTVNFEAGIEKFKSFKLQANNLVSDPSRGVLWAGIVKKNEDKEIVENRIVSFNPANGKVSPLVSFNMPLVPDSMVLSSGGRYLYFLLQGKVTVQRIDLSATTPTTIEIPLSANPLEVITRPTRVNVLVGDGTKFLVSNNYGGSLYVLENTTRTISAYFDTIYWTGSNLTKTSDPNVFISHSALKSEYAYIKIIVGEGNIIKTIQPTAIPVGYYDYLQGDGRFLLSSSGRLINSDTMTLISDLGMVGRPCVDALNQRAYIVQGDAVHVFNASTGAQLGKIPIPTSTKGDWARTCIRWGSDGLAILGDSEIFLAYTSLTQTGGRAISGTKTLSPTSQSLLTPAGDADEDGISNSIEHLFVTSPVQANTCPMKLTRSSTAGETEMHLSFPRRAGVVMPAYRYEVSNDLKNWEIAEGVLEIISSKRITEGVEVESVDAAIRVPNANRIFVRLRYLNE